MPQEATKLKKLTKATVRYIEWSNSEIRIIILVTFATIVYIL